MNRKIIFLALAAFLPPLCLPAQAQQAKKTPRIGFLVPGSATSFAGRIEAFRRGLRDLGHIEGRDITIEYRYADGKLERLPNFAAELIRLNSDLIVVAGTDTTAAAKNATKEIPIVMTNAGDPVRAGFVASLARPGGNITGLASNPSGLYGKRLEMLKEVLPKLNRLAILTDPQGPTSDAAFKETEAAAQALGLKLQLLEVRTADDIEEAFRAASKGRADALMVLNSSFAYFHGKRIADLAVKSRLPAMYNTEEAAFLMSYEVNRLELFRHAATYVDKILKGARPADLPVEQPTKFELVINLKTAKQIGLTIPPNVLARADRVIK
jgi:putative tryptophan/tyrosine transport system substrate-binding protein